MADDDIANYYREKDYLGLEIEPIDSFDSPLIIQVAPTGSFIWREENPNQPYTPEELAPQIEASIDAGASMAHVHVRDEDGIPDKSEEAIRSTLDPVFASHPDVVTSVNVRGGETSGLLGSDKLEAVVGPLQDGEYVDMVTTAANSKAPNADKPFVMNEAVLADWVGWLQDHDMKAEVNCYSYEAIENFYHWGAKTGAYEPPYYLNVVAGAHAYFITAPTSPFRTGAEYLASVREGNPFPDDQTVHGAIAGGRNWLPMTVEAILQGYDVVRIGMEDSATMYPHSDERIESNQQTVETVATIARQLGREVATPAQAREILDLPERSR